MRITAVQKVKLRELIGSNPQLRSGKFSASFTRKDAAKEWEQIAFELNSLPGAHKDWKSWRKTWQDIQSKIKSKSAAINRARRGTGGGPPPVPLDEFEEGVAQLLHPHAVAGHNNSTESAVWFQDPVTFQEEVEWLIDVPPLPLPVPSPPEPAIVDFQLSPPPQFVAETLPEPAPQSKEKKRKTNLKTLLKEKVDLKKEALIAKMDFYNAFIKNMERQAKALEDIAEAIKKTNEK